MIFLKRLVVVLLLVNTFFILKPEIAFGEEQCGGAVVQVINDCDPNDDNICNPSTFPYPYDCFPFNGVCSGVTNLTECIQRPTYCETVEQTGITIPCGAGGGDHSDDWMVGNVDGYSCTNRTISGWAVRGSGDKAKNVSVWINAVQTIPPVAPIWNPSPHQLTDIFRNDINSFYGITGNHGFNIDFPPGDGWLDGNSRTVKVGASGSQYLFGQLLWNDPITITCSAPPTPVNGVCATTHYNCTSPATSTDNRYNTPTWTWTCPGSYNGNPAYCSQAKPACRVTTSPSVRNLLVGGTGSITALVTSGLLNTDATIVKMAFGSYAAPLIATVTPTGPNNPDYSSPYVTTVTGVSVGNTAVWGTATLSDSRTCQSAWNTDTDVNVTAAPINGVCGSSHGGNFYTIPSSNLCSTGTATPVSGTGPWTWYCNGLNGGTNSSQCLANKKIDGVCSTTHYNCITGTTNTNVDGLTNWTWYCNGLNGGTNSPQCIEVKEIAWWQVVDADVTTNQNIISNVPSDNIFGLDGLGGSSGVPVYGTNFNLSTTPSLISTSKWQANTTTSLPRQFDYNYFENLMPDMANVNVITSSVLNNFNGTTYEGYEWYFYDGNRIGSHLQISPNSQPINLNDKRVILFVKNADLWIDGNITLEDNMGFFAVFVDGSIIIKPTVASLEGIYLSNGSFDTGSGNVPLLVRGSVASYGGITLGRNLDNNILPAETFEFAPDQIMLFPKSLMYKRSKWAEVAP